MNTDSETLFDTPLTPRVLAAREAYRAEHEAVGPDGMTDTMFRDTVRAAHTMATTREVREIEVPWWVVVPVALLVWVALFVAGFAVGRATAPVHTVTVVSCQVAGGPACTYDPSVTPDSAN